MNETAARSSLDWLVVGGGLHGVHLATRLIGEAEVDPTRLRILDPEEDLLGRWRALTAVTGMSHLRSPGVHHLDLEPFSLIHLAGNRRCRTRGLLRTRYECPALDLFNVHCDGVLERFGLRQLHLRDSAAHIEPGPSSVRVTTGAGELLETRRVILAIGQDALPTWPTWAPRDEPRIRHIFDRLPGCPSSTCGGGARRILVVGGGISAAQVALRLVGGGHAVTLLMRHALRIHRFDSDPGWLGPRLMP
ncbi:MAG: FAD/NAD(P)-binding protein, partial [Acidobacteriota bacterium]